MAAYNDGNTSRHKEWYDPDIQAVNPEIRYLLEEYSKIPAAKVVDHVNEIRARGFAANPYPCIGHYRFLNLTLRIHSLYESILTRLKSNPSSHYLDLGCCFGQDLRQLVYDGVPSAQLIGLDIEGPLLDLRYELLLDKEALASRFLVANIFEGESQGELWTSLVTDGVDIIHCSAFFHLFPLEAQKKAAKIIGALVRKGGMIVGRQSGSVKPGELPAFQPGTTSFRHNVHTWTEMWTEVGKETGVTWKVEGSLDEVGINTAKKTAVEDENSRRLLFSITKE
ncbi:uncharacterized protein N7483_006297 [Penicillium malachiteum]|uniref:uncharacterized protein n=1 Tax=Penicillium malachiteum TaxID=1324776 RepID=UPI002547A3A1|nr:uncharacterized protein N7483_006297 [Penicillium malachiteum]KAJ5731789.1 hypothetical protein N7483_006297 [Penicillium malachiteum]